MPAYHRQREFSRSWGFPGTRLDSIVRHLFFVFFFVSSFFLFFSFFLLFFRGFQTFVDTFPSFSQRREPEKEQARPGQARPGQARQASVSLKKVRGLQFISFPSGVKHFQLHLVPWRGLQKEQASKQASKQARKRTSEQASKTKDKRQKTKDKRQKTKDKRQKIKGEKKKERREKKNINLCRSRTPKAKKRRKLRDLCRIRKPHSNYRCLPSLSRQKELSHTSRPYDQHLWQDNLHFMS